MAIFKNSSGFTLHDLSSGVSLNTSELLNKKENDVLQKNFNQEYHSDENNSKHQLPLPGINLASDVDDNAILGMKRRRKRKSRTNLR